MPIEAIGATAVAPTGYLNETAPTDTSDGGFATMLTGAVDNLQALNGEKDTLSVQAVTGDLDNIHDATIAAARASSTLELLAGLRNKAVDGFNEIMRMQA